MSLSVNWTRKDYSRIPYWLYHDADVYKQEQDLIFRGATWAYLCLEAEIPNPGDYKTTWVGDTPILINRDRSGVIHAMVNRCSHRGAAVCRHSLGNTKVHTCIFLRWSFNLEGDLIGIPFQRGVKGAGGMDEDFNKSEHGLRKLKVASFQGVICATFAQEGETLEEYLGPMMCQHISRLMHKPINILGYQRQRIEGNWKYYLENLRDTYHASLLHEFLVTFGIDRVTQKGGIEMDGRHRHNLTYAHAGSDSDEDAKKA